MNLSQRSGVSIDFRLAYGNLTNYLERVAAGESARARYLAQRSFLHRSIPRYEQHFDPNKYDSVVTEANAIVIDQINQLVNQLNELREKGVTEFQELAPLRAQLDGLVLGSPRRSKE